ncbi:MAG: DeoR/GlpR transcriptional regulator, partial [Erysipelotrichaceae bacterium]|nr:DeoR/GlpR transcriptional regulator [Erysipelotrichaceae bacterium]
VRKDLDELEEKGIIHREHGYAILKNRDDLACRIAYHFDEKKKIARKAADLVKDGETLMIENGSCCALLADVLAEEKRDLTIITNSAYIANYIRCKSVNQIILLGGIYQQESQVLVGPAIRDNARNFFVDHFFIGTDGFSEMTGFTNQDQMRAQAVRDMAQQASDVIVLTESEKFHQHGIVPLNITDKIRLVITDDGIDEETRKTLESRNIETVIA